MNKDPKVSTTFHNKNILLVIPTGALGGAERQGLGISKILTENYNCKVDLLLTFSGEMNDEFSEFAQKCHIRNIFHVGPSYLYLPGKFSIKNLKRLKWSLQYLLLLRKKLKPYNYDIILPFLNSASKLAYYLYKLLPSVKFTFWHQLGLDKWSLDIFESIAAHNIPCIIANSRTGLEMISDHYKLKPDKLYILPQYISLKYEKGDKVALKAKFDISPDFVVIGMVAHFRSDKYHELLINVFEKLILKHSHIHLVLLGNKNISSTNIKKFNILNKMIEEKRLFSKISLLSEIKMEDVLNILDIGVLVSKIEGMPNAVMEYMLYGLPVVASNHPGCEQLLGDSPFLIGNDEKQLFDALEILILNKELRILESEKNKKLIQAYDMGSYIYKLEGIMNETRKNQ